MVLGIARILCLLPVFPGQFDMLALIRYHSLEIAALEVLSLRRLRK